MIVRFSIRGWLIAALGLSCGLIRAVAAESLRIGSSDHLAMLDQCASVWTSPCEKGVVSKTMTRGPLLGNGQMGVTATCSDYRVEFFLSNNGFISDGVRCTPVRIGSVTLSIPASADKGQFRMVQDIRNAELSCNLAGGLSLRAFVGNTRNALILELRNEGLNSLALQIDTQCPGSDRYPASAGVRNGIAFALRETLSKGEIKREVPDEYVPASKPGEYKNVPRRVSALPRWVCRAVTATRVVGRPSAATDDKAGAIGSTRFAIAPGEKAFVVAQCDYRIGESPLEETLCCVAKDTEESLESQKLEHLAWWRDFWSKSSVVLNDPLLDRYYNTAMYALGCCSRAGCAAPGLYGCWITTDEPLWGGDFHVNYNAQAPYSGVFSANHSEVAAPYNKVVLDFVPEARRRAAEDMRFVFPNLRDKHCRGVLFPVGLCPSFGVASCDRYLMQVSNASFCAMPMITQYEYMLDEVFLRNEVYPFVLACADFWESYIEQTTVDGKKLYTFSGGPCEVCWAPTPSTDIAFIQRIFRFLIRESETLGVDAGRRDKWRDLLDHLAPYPVKRDGSVDVIAWDGNGNFRPDHFCSGLDFIYPGNAVNQDTDDLSFLTLARVTACQYENWKYCNNMPRLFVARLQVGADPAKVCSAFRETVECQIAENGFLIDPFHGIEKCGGIEVVNRMLLSCDEDMIRFFNNWDIAKPAAYRNLRAKGGFLVFATCRDGRVQDIRIVSERGRICRFVNPWAGRRIKVTRNGSDAEIVEGERLMLKTAMGETLDLGKE